MAVIAYGRVWPEAVRAQFLFVERSSQLVSVLVLPVDSAKIQFSTILVKTANLYGLLVRLGLKVHVWVRLNQLR